MGCPPTIQPVRYPYRTLRDPEVVHELALIPTLLLWLGRWDGFYLGIQPAGLFTRQNSFRRIDQLTWFYTKGIGDDPHRLDGRVSDTPFNQADVGAIKAAMKSKLFLGEAGFTP